MNTIRSRQIGLNVLVGITLVSISALLQAANVQWVGNTGITPANGSISVATPVSIYTETWPIGSAISSRVVYSIDNGLTAWYGRAAHGNCLSILMAPPAPTSTTAPITPS